MTMLAWLSKWFKRAPLTAVSEATPPLAAQTSAQTDASAFGHINRGQDQQLSFAYDQELLDRALQHWQFGEWRRLSDLTDHDLEDHPERAKLALLAAAGLIQSGQMEDSRHWLKQAQKWGCTPKLIRQIMIAGVQNSLAQAALFAGQHSRAERLMESGVQTGMPHLDPRLVAQARLSLQRKRLAEEYPYADKIAHYKNGEKKPFCHVNPPQLDILNKARVVAEFNLGQAWAGNTVNTAIFRHHGMLTHEGLQFTAFYVDEQTLRFVCRRLTDNHISQYDLKGEYTLQDAHNSISLGVDRVGFLHACFDHHASQLRYRRSLYPLRIDGWTDDQPMTGKYEEKVTYPTFILPRSDYPLTLLYRDGTHNAGSARLKYYDESSFKWRDKPTPILSGVDQKPWTSNAYWNHPAIGSDGSLHLSFVWRTGVLGEERLVNNINIGYAWSVDNGHHWYSLQGQPYQVPITPTTAETIWPFPAGCNLINQCSMVLDRFNRPHIAFYANDAEGVPQYQHLSFDGKIWKNQILSTRTNKFQLQGAGTLQVPISRPSILIDNKDDIYVFFRGDLTNNRMAFQKLVSPDYFANPKEINIIWDEDLGYAEPLIDRVLWSDQKRLVLLLQSNSQPDGDLQEKYSQEVIRIVELELH